MSNDSTRFCRCCNERKSAEDFYASSRFKCKVCYRAAVAANRRLKADYYKAFDKERANDPDRVAARVAYRQTSEGKAAALRANRAWRQRNRQKVAAHNVVARAIAAGALIRKPCEECQDTPAEAHHDDYSKPLGVRWLCKKHHDDHHREA